MQNHDLRKLATNKYLRTSCCYVLGAFCAFQVGAATIADSAFDRFMSNTVGAGQTSVGFSSTGTPVTVTGNGNLVTDNTAKPLYTRSGQIKNPSGNPVTVTAAARIPSASVAALIKKALPLVPVLGTGVALYDLAQELGYQFVGSGGALQLAKTVGTSQVVNSCTGNTPFSGLGQYVYDAAKNKTFVSLAAVPSLPYPVPAGALFELACTDQNVYSSSWQATSMRNNGAWSYWPYIVSYPGNTLASQPKTLDDFETDIAVKSGWPSTSKLPDAIAQATTITGDRLQPETATVTGPATSTGTTKTVVNPDGTKLETVTSHQHTYQGDKITTSTTTIENTYNTSNQITSTTTTTETPETPTDTATDCEKNPDSLGCLKAEFDTPTDQVPKTTKNITYQAEDLGFGGGSCPADKVVQVAGVGPVTVFDWVTACDQITTYAKPMILAMAVFAAMMIIFAGRVES